MLQAFFVDPFMMMYDAPLFFCGGVRKRFNVRSDVRTGCTGFCSDLQSLWCI